MKISMTIALLLAVVMTVSGCGASGLMIIKSTPIGIEEVSVIQVNEIKSDVYIPEKACEQIRDIVINKLEKTSAFKSVSKNSGKIVLDIKIISFDGGDQFARWFFGGIGDFGEGKIILETAYSNVASKNEIGKIRTEGSIKFGLFGGSVKTAYSNAVDEIVRYTVDHFGNR